MSKALFASLIYEQKGLIERMQAENDRLHEICKQAEILMDALAIKDIGDWLNQAGPQYRRDWAEVHTELREIVNEKKA